MTFESMMGAALNTLHDALVAHATAAGIKVPERDWILTVGTPRAADAAKTKDGETVKDVRTLVQVFEPLPDARSGEYKDKVTRIEVNDRLTLGGSDFYAAALHGFTCMVLGLSTRSNGTKTYYGDGWTETFRKLGGTEDKQALTDTGEAFRKVTEGSIKWPLVARVAELKVKKGGGNQAFILRVFDKKGNPIKGDDGKPLGYTIRLGKVAAMRVKDTIDKGGRFKVELGDLTGEATVEQTDGIAV